MSNLDSDYLARVRAFCERADRVEAQGLHFQHAALCARRCWLHLHRASMNDWSDLIRLGAVRHADSHTRDHSAEGLFGLRPDRIDWTARIVIEEKSSQSHPDAAEDQLAFYLALLIAATGQNWQGRLTLLGARRNREVSLAPARLERLETSLTLIECLRHQRSVPPARRLPVCSGCSNAELCGFLP